MAQLIHILTLTGIFIILGASLNIALGYTGIINLGHVAFFGVGAYTSAILTKTVGLSFFLALPIAGLLAALSAWVLVRLIGRLSGDYVALATLAFAFMAHALFTNWTSLTRGPLGIPAIPRPELFGMRIGYGAPYLVLVVIVTVVSLWLMHRIVRSRYGRLLEAVRDDAIGLAARGKHVAALKAQSMMISGFFAGIAGSLYAHYVTFIDPSTFFINDIVILLTIVLVGGLASLKGSVVAGFIVIMLPELLRYLDLPQTMVGSLRQILYTVLILLLLLYRPRGIFGRVDLETAP